MYVRYQDYIFIPIRYDLHPYNSRTSVASKYQVWTGYCMNGLIRGPDLGFSPKSHQLQRSRSRSSGGVGQQTGYLGVSTKSETFISGDFRGLRGRVVVEIAGQSRSWEADFDLHQPIYTRRSRLPGTRFPNCFQLPHGRERLFDVRKPPTQYDDFLEIFKDFHTINNETCPESLSEISWNRWWRLTVTWRPNSPCSHKTHLCVHRVVPDPSGTIEVVCSGSRLVETVEQGVCCHRLNG